MVLSWILSWNHSRTVHRLDKPRRRGSGEWRVVLGVGASPFLPPTLFCKSVIRWDVKYRHFVRVSSKGLTGAFFVRVDFKGPSKLAIDSKGVICCKLGQAPRRS